MPIIQPKPVTIDDVTYPSYAQAEKALGWSKGSVSKWVAQQQAQADAGQEDTVPISEPEALVADEQSQCGNTPRSDTDHQEKRLIYGGVEYKTRKEMANALRVDYLKLNAYLRKYDDIDEAVERCLVGKTSMSVSYGGYVHRSFTALCESYGIAPALVKQVAEANGSDKLEAFSGLAELRSTADIRDDITLTFVPYSVLQGEPYRNLAQLARQFDIERDILEGRVEERGLSNALKFLQAERVGAYYVSFDDKLVPFEEVVEQIKNGELEKFEVGRKWVPKYPKLQDVDISGQCLDQGQVQKIVQNGQPAGGPVQQDVPAKQGPVMTEI